MFPEPLQVLYQYGLIVYKADSSLVNTSYFDATWHKSSVGFSMIINCRAHITSCLSVRGSTSHNNERWMEGQKRVGRGSGLPYLAQWQNENDTRHVTSVFKEPKGTEFLVKHKFQEPVAAWDGYTYVLLLFFVET